MRNHESDETRNESGTLFFKHNNLLTTTATATATSSIRVKCCEYEKRMFEKHSSFFLSPLQNRERERNERRNKFKF